MRRTKEWWAALTPEERSHLVNIERGNNGGNGNLPDDSSGCDACGQPILGDGLCDYCYESWKGYIEKANRAVAGETK